MAWISVHEQVTGMKLRELSKSIGCSQKEALGILITLWLWGINNATKEGELKGSDKSDIKDALSTGLSDGLSSDKIVDCLIEKQWIDIVDNKYVLHDWDIWQEQWYKALDRRVYDAQRKREERKQKDGKNPQENPMDSPQENPAQPSPSPSPSPSPKPNRKPQPDNKEDIYSVFDHYCEVFQGYYKTISLTPTREKHIKARLEKYSINQIKLAITNIRTSKYHLGEETNNDKFYATLEFICRNDETLEKWINHIPKKAGNKNTNKALEMYVQAKEEEGGQAVW
jgi:hypothetical protein